MNEDILSEKSSAILVFSRVCLLGFLLFIASYYSFVEELSGSIRIEELFVPIAVLFGISSISALWLSHVKPGKYFTQIELIIYSGIVTGLIYFTGLNGSPLLFLYLPLVMLAGLLSSRKNTLFLAIINLLFYYFSIENDVNNWLVLPELAERTVLPKEKLYFQLLALISSMALVGIATSFLKHRLNKQNQEIRDVRSKIEELELEEFALLNTLDEGVVVFNEQKEIVKINNFAIKLLNLTNEKNIKARDIFTLNKELENNIFKNKAPNSFHLNINNLDLSFKKSIYSKNNNDLTLVIFNDLTKITTVEKELEMQNKMARLLAVKDPNPTGSYKLNDHFIGHTEIMKKIFKTILKVADSEANVLIIGESGTGKELVAKALHNSSFRQGKPFVAVNCGAIPESLIESQLFGHKKGSFTSSVNDHKGYFEQAEGGTLFLDEIGELPIQMQAKLLRVIQERKIRPIGSEKEIPIDVRVVSATNKILEDEVKNNLFREDLYYRLNVVNIKIPPLRERKEDIPILIDYIIKKITKNNINKDVNAIVPPETLKLLMNHNYPGNIRELENIIERAIILGGDIILPENLPEQLRGGDCIASEPGKREETKLIVEESVDLNESFDLDNYLKDIERKYLETALAESNGKKTQAAKLLGMNFRSFRYRLEKFGIDAED